MMNQNADPRELQRHIERTLMLSIALLKDAGVCLENLNMYLKESKEAHYGENLSYIHQVVMPAVDVYREYFESMEEGIASRSESE